MGNITKWFGKAIYITALDNFEKLNKEIIQYDSLVMGGRVRTIV